MKLELEFQENEQLLGAIEENGADVDFAFSELDGFDYGKAEGIEIGKAEGYNNGYSAGKADGYTEGQRAGFNEGYSSGEAIGYENGKNDGITIARKIKVFFFHKKHTFDLVFNRIIKYY